MIIFICQEGKEVYDIVLKTTPKEGKTEIKNLTRKVPFELPSPEAKEVCLVGEFNHWDIQADQMKKDKNGIWKTMVSLKPGRYEYR
jgi:1,4-alpha-glucan branching enzyme